MRISESSFRDLLAKDLSEYGWFVKKEVFDHNRKNRLDILMYHPSIDCWIGVELKVPQSNKDYTKCLLQLIRYRKSRFTPSPDLLCLISSSNVEWFHYRYFWRFGFGVGVYKPDWMPLWVRFPPNGNSKETLELDNLDRSFIPPKEKATWILSVCIPRWRIFGYEHKR